MNQQVKEAEAENLKLLLKDAYVENYADFARNNKIPGGKSMLSQHLNAVRPISLESAIAYSTSLGKPLIEISPRLAALIEQLPVSTGQDQASYEKKIKSLPNPARRRLTELIAIAEQMSERGQDILLGRAQELAIIYPRPKANSAS